MPINSRDSKLNILFNIGYNTDSTFSGIKTTVYNTVEGIKTRKK
jgi:hypothetical protein